MGNRRHNREMAYSIAIFNPINTKLSKHMEIIMLKLSTNFECFSLTFSMFKIQLYVLINYRHSKIFYFDL